MEQISFVYQEVRLFKKSIRDNIRAARPEATEEEILLAAQLAQCGDILEKTPGGLDAVIGAKGVYLSGGEMQLIAQVAQQLLLFGDGNFGTVYVKCCHGNRSPL